MKPWTVNRIRDTVRALLKAGADPHVKDVEQSDALDLALESDSEDVVHILFSVVQKPEPPQNATDTTGCGNYLAKMRARRWKREDVMSSLLAQDLAFTPDGATALLLQAFSEGDEHMIEALLDLGADPFHADRTGSTALHCAVSNLLKGFRPVW